MARRMMRIDAIESEIELALSPGEFIRDRACFSFVSGLEKIVTKTDALAATAPACAAGLCETFLAGYYSKAEEIDDSSGSSTVCPGSHRPVDQGTADGGRRSERDGRHHAGVDAR